MSNAEAVQQTMAKVVKDFGKIDVFVANAGESLPLIYVAHSSHH